MAEFKVGDIVHLKSGSPWMTVEKVHADTVDVVWVSGLGVNRLTISPDCFIVSPVPVESQTR